MAEGEVMIRKFLHHRYGQNQTNDGKRYRLGGLAGQGKRGGHDDHNKPASGPGGNCICPKCGKEVSHMAGQRCIAQICPDCGTKMVHS
jgi:hypothetical protein